MPRIILASASNSRKKLLEAAGLTFDVIVSNVDEEAPIYQSLTPKEMVIALSIVKAHTVRELIDYPALLLACDSTFEFEGKSLGKPLTTEVAIARAKSLSGKSGYLHTGHCIIDLENGIEISDIATTKVHFGEMNDQEITDYVASGEPLHVAGGFTLDGLSSAFIDSIEGDYTNVIGLSVPLLRSMILRLGYSWHDLITQPMGAKN